MKKVEINKIIENAKVLKMLISEGKDDTREIFETLCSTLDKIVDVQADIRHIKSMIIESFTKEDIDFTYWSKEYINQNKAEIKLIEKLKNLI